MNKTEKEYLHKMLELAASELSKSERKKIIDDLLATGKFNIEQIAYMTDKEIILQSYIIDDNWFYYE